MKLAHYSTVAENQKIDRASGIISGVSVITLGRAQGHNMKIDEKTLDQILAVAQSHKDGIKVKFGNDHKAGVEDTIGALKNFRKDGEQIRADLHLLQSCPRYGQILEMAEKLPNEFGLSAVFSGEHEEIEKVKFARCQEIYSVDLVSDPAANPTGLFAKGSEEDGVALEADGKTHKKDCMCMDCKKKMSDNKKKSMSELLTPEFVTELKKLMGDNTTELATKLATLETQLATSTKTALENAKKTEIAALVAEASKSGKVIPLSDAVLMKLEVAEVKEIIGKLTPSVKLSKGFTPAPPKDTEGKEIFDRHTPEGRAKVLQFCRQKQSENAAALGAEIKRNNAAFFEQNN